MVMVTDAVVGPQGWSRFPNVSSVNDMIVCLNKY
jgi:hypothetical protein